MVIDRLLVVRVFTRLAVSTHFVFELQDKLVNFSHWQQVILTQANLGAWALVLVILLLVVGVLSLLSGRWLRLGFAALLVFQVPTSALFEDSLYESMDSISALGGVLAVAAWAWDVEQKQKRGEGCAGGVEGEGEGESGGGALLLGSPVDE